MEKLKDQFLENCHKNDLNAVTDCLSNGVDINTVSEDGYWSGLTIAAIRNNPELLEILLSHPHIKIIMNLHQVPVICSQKNCFILDKKVKGFQPINYNIWELACLLFIHHKWTLGNLWVFSQYIKDLKVRNISNWLRYTWGSFGNQSLLRTVQLTCNLRQHHK